MLKVKKIKFFLIGVEFITLFIVFFCKIILHSQTEPKRWKKYPYKAPGGKIIFPLDEGAHNDSRMEWWYFNLHLKCKKSGKSYGMWVGYIYKFNIRFVGFADNDTKKFISEVVPSAMISKEGKKDFKYIGHYGTDHWYQIEGKPFVYALKVYFRNVFLDVVMDCQKPPLPLNNNGLIYFNPKEFTYYYSFTNMKITGKITINNKTEEVEGIGWEDHQWGNFFLHIMGKGTGYEWYCVQVNNEKGDSPIEIVFYQLFTPDKKITNPMFSLIGADNSIFSTKEFTVERLAFWQSPHKSFFSNKWRLIEKTQEIDLEITPYQDNQLLYPPKMQPFREGPCYVKGKIKGKDYSGTAFVENFRRYQHPQVRLIYPNGGETFRKVVKMFWSKPDDEALTLKYTVSYSDDGGLSFKPIAFDVRDRFFSWDVTNLSGCEGKNFKIKVTATSLDGTLSGEDVSDGTFQIRK